MPHAETKILQVTPLIDGGGTPFLVTHSPDGIGRYRLYRFTESGMLTLLAVKADFAALMADCARRIETP